MIAVEARQIAALASTQHTIYMRDESNLISVRFIIQEESELLVATGLHGCSEADSSPACQCVI